MKLSNRAENIANSLTLEITAKANELKNNGIDLVSFAAGEPDFNTPDNIINAAIKAMHDGKTKYTAVSGITELKEAIREKLKKDNNLDYNNNQIIVCNGAKQCLANVFYSIINDGDEVIIGKPYWVSYPELVKLCGGVPVFADTSRDNSYKLTVEDLKRHLTSKTKAILINSPGNPTGHVYSKEELIEIAEFAKENDLFIISDEIYEKLIYTESNHVSIASLSEDAYNRTIVINGVSKTYAMTGWRMGYCAASEEIIKLMTKVQSHTTANVNTITQYAAIEAMTGDQSSVLEMKKAFAQRRIMTIDLLNNIDGLSYINPEGAFYVMIDISNFIGKAIDGNIIGNSMEFSKLLLEKEYVAVIPGIAFGFENYIRISYATSEIVIKEGLKRIANFISNLK